MLRWYFLFCLALTGLWPSEQIQIKADKVTYDAVAKQIKFSGNVFVTQNHGEVQRSIACDHVVYKMDTKKIFALGNILFLDANGDEIHADQLNLTKDFQHGALSPVALRNKDDATLEASEAVRVDGNHSNFSDVRYTPCLHKDQLDNAIWYLEADKVEHKQDDHVIVFRHVYLIFQGVKIFYFPYFSYPDPSVKNKSGFLVPNFGYSADLGSFALTPYLLTDGNQDLTISPMLMSKKSPVFITSYRKRFINAAFQMGGSFTYANNNNEKLQKLTKSRKRWHFSQDLAWNINDNWNFNSSFNRASDTTYLSRYRINRQRVFDRQKNLISSVNIENFQENSYALGKIQSLQTDRPETAPTTLPYIKYLVSPHQFENGSYLTFDNSLLFLLRHMPEISQSGRKTLRGSSGLKWSLPLITQNGQFHTVTLSNRVDFYVSRQYNPKEPTLKAQENYDSSPKYRYFPQLSYDWRMPLINEYVNCWVLEPRLMVAVAPKNMNRWSLPNEDSRMVTFDNTSLFLPNRFDGIDRVDEGVRTAYGIDNHFTTGLHKISVFLGQSRRLDNKSVIGENQGESKKFSDYVGRVNVEYADYLKVFFQSLVESKRFNSRVSEIGAVVGKPIFQLDAAYVHAKKGLNNSEQMISQLSLQVSSKFYDNWQIHAAQIRNLKRYQKGALATFIGIQYEDDCFTSKFQVFKTHYRDRDIKPDTGFLLQFSLKNLGTLTPTSAPQYPRSVLMPN